MTNASIFEQLSLSTIRVACQTADGGSSVGTGFFFNFAVEGETCFPVLVTNKHVVKNSVRGFLRFTLGKTLDGPPVVGKTVDIELFNSIWEWIPHPDPLIDLCMLPIGPILNGLSAQGINIFRQPLKWDLLPSEHDIGEMTGAETVFMIGYPTGLWDAKHNLPIIRTGTLATHYQYDLNGKPECLIDCACFPGSSGSPIFICDVGNVPTRSGLRVGATRLHLLGILYAGPMWTVEGEIIAKPISTNFVSLTDITLNLGFFIKSRMLKDFDPIAREKQNYHDTEKASNPDYQTGTFRLHRVDTL